MKKKSLKEKLLGKMSKLILPDNIDETIAQILEPIDKKQFTDFDDFLRAKWKDSNGIFESPKDCWFVNYTKKITPAPFSRSIACMSKLMHVGYIVVLPLIGPGESFKAFSITGTTSDSILLVGEEYAMAKTPMMAVAIKYLQIKGYKVVDQKSTKGKK